MLSLVINPMIHKYVNKIHLTRLFLGCRKINDVCSFIVSQTKYFNRSKTAKFSVLVLFCFEASQAPSFMFPVQIQFGNNQFSIAGCAMLNSIQFGIK